VHVPSDFRAPSADAIQTASGLSYKILSTAGSTDKPMDSDTVTVHYTGWTTNGMMFDSSFQRGMPITLALTQVIPGWTEGLQLMAVGDKARFWIPEELAYKGRSGPPAGMLIFDIELLEIDKPIPTPTH
jgi:peptidylprolyl isomerase